MNKLYNEYRHTTNHAYITGTRESRAPEMDVIAANKYIANYLERCRQRLIYLNKEEKTNDIH